MHTLRGDRREPDGKRDGDDGAHPLGDHLRREQRRDEEQRCNPREHDEERRHVGSGDSGDELVGG